MSFKLPAPDRMSMSRYFQYLGCSFLLVAALSGCKNNDEPLRIGFVVWPPFEMAYLAEDLGYFEGANIELIDYGSPPEFFLAYQAGALDAVGAIMDHALINQLAGQSNRIVMIIDHSKGSDAVVARSPAKSMKDLKGAKVGYEASPLGAYMLTRALELNEMEMDDIQLVTVDIQNQEDTFRKGDVDGLVTYEPIVTSLKKEGHSVVFDSSQIPFEVIDLLLVQSHLSEAKEEKLAKFVEGWFKAVDYFRKYPIDAAKRVIEREQMSVDDYLASFEGVDLVSFEDNLRYLSGPNPLILPILKKHEENMIRRGFLKGRPDTTSLIDGSVLKTVPK